MVMFLVSLGVYGATAGPRLKAQSRDPHFVVQAQAWLMGRLDIPRWPVRADDPAIVEEVELDDGNIVKGRWLRSRLSFQVAGANAIPAARIRQRRRAEYHVAFPPFPAVAFVPIVALFGADVSDVVATVLLAAMAPALLLALLRRLREEGLSNRSASEDLWLAVLLAFGTVFFFSAVQGRVWFTAHVMAVDLCILFVWASIGAARPAVAGMFLGLAFLTRTPLLFMFPFFVAEMWRAGRQRDLGRWVAFLGPVAALGILAAWHNHARFDDIMEFGHRYLSVRQQVDIERYGLFDLHYLSRNVTAALVLLPDISARPPYVSISGHGLAIWVTTPPLILLLSPYRRGVLHRALWITTGSIAVWTLVYQNTGWFQFGYRFSLDYMVFLIVLLAVGGRPFARFVRGLIVIAVLVNLFGAITFDRYYQFYRTDAAAYDSIIDD